MTHGSLDELAQYTVPYSPVGTSFGLEELHAITAVLTSGETLSCGPTRAAFEGTFAKFVGAAHALSLTSCTSALELATYLLDLQPGDQVVVTSQTYQATCHSLLGRADIDVAFADIDPRSLNLDPVAVERCVTDRTRAIYLVHYGGLMADMRAICEVARRHDLVVIEDCAHALGSTLDGEHAGTWGDVGCFSFQSCKNVSTLGEGGMITVRNSEWAGIIDRVRSIEPDVQGASIRWGGTNSTLSEVACAVGLVQLDKLKDLNARRTDIARRLDNSLSKITGIDTQASPPGYTHTHHLYTAFCRAGTGLDRDQLLRDLTQGGVHIQQRYEPVHLLAEWQQRGHGRGECPNAERAWFEEQVNLPIYPALADWQIDHMIEVFRSAVERQAG